MKLWNSFPTEPKWYWFEGQVIFPHEDESGWEDLSTMVEIVVGIRSDMLHMWINEDRLDPEDVCGVWYGPITVEDVKQMAEGT